MKQETQTIKETATLMPVEMLNEAALDYAVYLCEESTLRQPHLGTLRHCMAYGLYKPSINYEQGLSIMKREKINIDKQHGALEEGLRLYIKNKLGDEVYIPKKILIKN